MNQKSPKMSRSSFLFGFVMWAAVAIGLGSIWLRPENSPENSAVAQDGTSAETPIRPGATKDSFRLRLPERKLPDFEFEKVTGGTLSLNDLKGKRWVAAFVFSRCTETCPVISRAVMQVHDRVAEQAPDVHFVSISVDPGYDSAEIFGNYAETFTGGDFSRWTFLSPPSKQAMEDLIVRGFGVYVKENVGKTRLPGLEVAHSNRVVLVNEDTIPVATFLGTKPGDMAKLSRILMGKDDFPEPGPPASESGLTFSTSDGSPLNMSFEVKRVDEDGNEIADSESGDGGDTSAGESDDGEAASATESPDVSSSEITVKEHNAVIEQKLPAWAKKLPTVNAMLNTIAAILLMAGLVAIKAENKTRHRNLMIAAFLTSVVFLVSYLTYHWALGKYTGEHGRRFSGTGISAVVYQLILWPHIILAAVVPILATRVFMHAFAERWEAHKRLAKITFPIWMFVSVTGVVIYGMLYHWPA